jgi:hypothetical protein
MVSMSRILEEISFHGKWNFSNFKKPRVKPLKVIV